MTHLLHARQLLSGLTVSTFALAAMGAAGAQTTHTVNQISKTFVSANITIEVGDTVRWVWSSGSHTVTEGVGPFPTGNEAFHASLIDVAPLYEVTFDGDMLLDNPRTNHLYDYYCIPHFGDGMLGSVQVNSAWVNLLASLPGIAGPPRLLGTGTLAAGSPLTLELSDAKPNASSGLFLGLSAINLPFKNGTLVPNPDFLFLLPTNSNGDATLPTTWPAGVPAGFVVYFQWWVQDAAAVVGLAASNALAGTAQ